ncbi:MAG TPA: hypothetical protein VE988_06715 [Gemmataceae bacterium]|nr:hypothetical protein [Gemmataceae bacterium]
MRVGVIGRRRSLVAAMVLAGPCLLFLAGQSGAQGKGEKNTTPPKAEKKVYIIPEGSWAKVLDWLKDETGLPIISSWFPTGTFRLPAVYEAPITITEVIDLLNDALELQKCMLRRREASIMIWPTDEPLPPGLALTWDPNQPHEFGRTEFAKMELQSKRLKGNDLLLTAMPWMTKMGHWVGPDKSGKITLTDTAEGLRRVSQRLRDLDADNRRRGVPRESWQAALEWLSKRTGLPLVGEAPAKPLGGQWPERDGLVIAEEIVDLLNDTLAEQKLIIVRGQRGIHVVSNRKAIDKTLVANIRWADLAERGKTEPVAICVTFKNLKAEEAIGKIKPLLSGLGNVEKAGESEVLVLDSAGNLQAILSKLRQTGGSKNK